MSLLPNEAEASDDDADSADSGNWFTAYPLFWAVLVVAIIAAAAIFSTPDITHF